MVFNLKVKIPGLRDFEIFPNILSNLSQCNESLKIKPILFPKLY